jgi:hypothetical protein
VPAFLAGFDTVEMTGADFFVGIDDDDGDDFLVDEAGAGAFLEFDLETADVVVFDVVFFVGVILASALAKIDYVYGKKSNWKRQS